MNNTQVTTTLTNGARIKIKKEVSNLFDQAEAEKYFAWLYEKTVLFQRVFGKYFKEFKK